MIFGLIAAAATIVLHFLKMLGPNPIFSYICLGLLAVAVIETIGEMFTKKTFMKILAIGFTAIAVAAVIYFVAYQAMGILPLK